jgi:glycosyltransferase involved in cell wall biosynthesis
MKILEINKFNFKKGGADKHFLDVVSLFESHRNEVAVFSMNHLRNEKSKWDKYFLSYVGYNKDDSNLLQKIVGIGRMFYSFSAKRKIRKILNDFKPEIVHIHNIYHQISFSIISEIKKRKIPIVMTVHDYHLISPDREKYYEEIGRRYWKFIFLGKKYNLLKRIILILKSYFEDILNWKSKIDLFVSPSEFVKKRLILSGIDEKKIMVLPHFIPGNKKEDIQEKAKAESSKSYAFYFGRIFKDKGIDEMINTFGNINGIKLLIAGDIEDQTKIDGKNVEYLGFLDQNKLKNYIENAKFCVSFSRLPETFGLIALESISMGKPFVALDNGAYSEVIDNGKTGFICKDIDEIRKIITAIANDKIIFDENEIREVAKKRFSSDKYYEDILDIFNLLIQKNEK